MAIIQQRRNSSPVRRRLRALHQTAPALSAHGGGRSSRAARTRSALCAGGGVCDTASTACVGPLLLSRLRVLADSGISLRRASTWRCPERGRGIHLRGLLILSQLRDATSAGTTVARETPDRSLIELQPFVQGLANDPVSFRRGPMVPS